MLCSATSGRVPDGSASWQRDLIANRRTPSNRQANTIASNSVLEPWPMGMHDESQLGVSASTLLSQKASQSIVAFHIGPVEYLTCRRDMASSSKVSRSLRSLRVGEDLHSGGIHIGHGTTMSRVLMHGTRHLHPDVIKHALQYLRHVFSAPASSPLFTSKQHKHHTQNVPATRTLVPGTYPSAPIDSLAKPQSAQNLLCASNAPARRLALIIVSANLTWDRRLRQCLHARIW